MPCLALLVALLSPRAAIIVMWLFSNILGRAYDSALLPIIGFFLLPWTTFTYALMWDLGTHKVTGLEWFVVVFAFLMDLASHGGTMRGRR